MDSTKQMYIFGKKKPALTGRLCNFSLLFALAPTARAAEIGSGTAVFYNSAFKSFDLL